VEKQRTKLCPHCEGRLPISLEECPYCGQSIFSQATLSLKAVNENASFVPPYLASWDEQPLKEEKPAAPKVKEAAKDTRQQKSLLLTIIMMTLGSYLFALGLLVFLFSENGKLVLEWKSKYSLLYCFMASPFLYIGFLRLKSES
jgi:hypothetical protein